MRQPALTIPAVVERARQLGARVELAGAGRIVVYPPNRDARPVHIGVRTNRDSPNHVRNVVNELLRVGLDVSSSPNRKEPAMSKPAPTPSDVPTKRAPAADYAFSPPATLADLAELRDERRRELAELRSGYESLLGMLAEAEQRDQANRRELAELRAQCDSLRIEVTKLRMQIVRATGKAGKVDQGAIADEAIVKLLTSLSAAGVRLTAGSIAASLTGDDGQPAYSSKLLGSRLTLLVKAGKVASNADDGQAVGSRLYWVERPTG